jgi:hypothetical protein
LEFDAEDNWSDVPAYAGKSLLWEILPDSVLPYVYQTQVGAETWRIRLNRFPEEPLYTLIVDEKEIIHFTEWSAEWKKS